MIKAESDEAGLPPDCEALLVPENGRLNPADVIEDELLLVLPLVPVNPDSSLPDEMTGHAPVDDSSGEGRSENPFAVLRELKEVSTDPDFSIQVDPDHQIKGFRWRNAMAVAKSRRTRPPAACVVRTTR